MVCVTVWWRLSTAEAQTITVTFLHTPPARAVEGQPLTIRGNIVGADMVSIAALAYRAPGESEYQVAELKLEGGDRYQGVIPAKAIRPPAIEYYCYAVDFEGNQHVIFASSIQPQRLEVISREEASRRTGIEIPQKVAAPSRTPSAKSEEAPSAQSLAATAQLATGIEQPLERAPAAVTVVERDEIERAGYQTLAELLDRVAGISISRSVSGEYRLAMRGVLGGPEVLVLLDGRRLSEPWRGSGLLEFPAEAIERVEIMRGPATGLYGDGALVGVVSVHTRQGDPLRAYAGCGRFYDTRISTGGGFSSGRLRAGGQLQFWYTGGQRRVVEADLLSGVGDDEANKDVSNTPGPVDDTHLQLHAQTQGELGTETSSGRLGWLMRYLYQERGALVGKMDTLDQGSSIDTHLIQADLDYRLALGEKIFLESSLWLDTRLQEESFQVISGSNDSKYIVLNDPNDPNDDIVLTDGLRESLSTTVMGTGGAVGIGWQPFSGHHLHGKVELDYLRLHGYRQERSIGSLACPAEGLLVQGYLLPCGVLDGPGAGQDRLRVGVMLSDLWQDLLLKGLDINAAMRLDWADDYGLALGPSVGVVWQPWSRLWLKTSYGMAYRAPTFEEMYADAKFDPLRGISGNPALKPVTSHTWSVGLATHWPGRLVQVRWSGGFFLGWTSGGITGLDTGSGIPMYENSEAQKSMGLETEVVAAFGQRSRLRVNGSWFRIETSSSGRPAASYITDVPQLRLNAALEIELSDWLDAHLDLRLGSERRNNVRRELEMLHSFRIPAWALVGAGLSTRPVLFGHLAFFVFAENLLGQDMRDPPPQPHHLPGLIPREPFSIFAGVRWLEAGGENKSEKE